MNVGHDLGMASVMVVLPTIHIHQPVNSSQIALRCRGGTFRGSAGLVGLGIVVIVFLVAPQRKWVRLQCEFVCPDQGSPLAEFDLDSTEEIKSRILGFG